MVDHGYERIVRKQIDEDSQDNTAEHFANHEAICSLAEFSCGGGIDSTWFALPAHVTRAFHSSLEDVIGQRNA
jgi:hypothetical protein